MRSRSAQHATVAVLSLLVALVAGVATLRAAIGGERGAAAPALELSADGSISLSNSDDGAAIFDLPNLGPGDGGQGEVTIANDGSLPGALALASLDRGDAPGRYGGTLSERLRLRLDEVSSGTAVAIYDGRLGAMPELQLGTLAAGAARTYRFAVTMLDGGAPASPYVDDNVYQRGSTTIGYDWTLTELEAADPEPPVQPPAQPPAAHPTAPPSPVPATDPEPAPQAAPRAGPLGPTRSSAARRTTSSSAAAGPIASSATAAVTASTAAPGPIGSTAARAPIGCAAAPVRSPRRRPRPRPDPRPRRRRRRRQLRRRPRPCPDRRPGPRLRLRARRTLGRFGYSFEAAVTQR